MRGDQMRLPVHGRISELAASFWRTGVLCEIEIEMHGIRLADRSCGHLSPCLQHRWNEIAIPHQELHATAFDGFDESLSFATARGQWLVLNDVYAKGCSPNT